MRETLVTLAAATLCAVVLQLVDAQLHPDRGPAPPPPGAMAQMRAAYVRPLPPPVAEDRGPPPPDFVVDRFGDMMLR